MSISSKDYPGWQGMVGDKDKARSFGVDLNDNVALKDMKVPHGVLLAAIDRDHEVIIPGGNDSLSQDDYVFVVGEPKALGAFEKKLGTRANYLRDVVMYGASAEIKRNEQVKICFKKMNHPKPMHHIIARCFLCHDVNNLLPSHQGTVPLDAKIANLQMSIQ